MGTGRGAMLTRAEVAAMAGLASAEVVDVYRSRGGHDGSRIPEPDGYLGRSPYWHEATIRRWIKTRHVRADVARARAAAQ